MTKTAHVYPRGKYPSRVLANIRSRSLIDGSLGYVKVHLFTAAAWNAMVAEIKRETGKTTTLELQHQCTTTKTVNGLGQASTFTVNEVYSELIFTKVG